MSSCSSKTDTETLAPLSVTWSITSALLHSSPHISQTLHQIIHILHFCLVDSSLNYTQDIVVSLIDVKAVYSPVLTTDGAFCKSACWCVCLVKEIEPGARPRYITITCRQFCCLLSWIQTPQHHSISDVSFHVSDRGLWTF